jgi:amino acid transporter
MRASAGEIGPGLEPRALGFVPVLFQSIVFAGPAVGVALSLVFLASYAGAATPLATILTTLAILLIAVSIGELGSKLPSAGGLYTYVAAGMGEGWGPESIGQLDRVFIDDDEFDESDKTAAGAREDAIG